LCIKTSETILETYYACAALSDGGWPFIDADKWAQVISSALVLSLYCSQLFWRPTLWRSRLLIFCQDKISLRCV